MKQIILNLLSGFLAIHMFVSVEEPFLSHNHYGQVIIMDQMAQQNDVPDEQLLTLFEQFLQDHPDLAAADAEILKGYIAQNQTDLAPEIQVNVQDEEGKFYSMHVTFDAAKQLGMKAWTLFIESLKNPK